MKLPIKKKFFDRIKNGDKDLEWRDAHITFICEETGETLRKEIIDSKVIPKGKFEEWDFPTMAKEEFDEMFEDEKVIGFALN